MALWREALNGAIAGAFVQEDATGVPVYPREPRSLSDMVGADAPAPVVTCASCRRSVTPQRGALGAECPRCHGLVAAKLPPAQQVRRPRAKPEPRAPVVAAVAEQLLGEAAEAVTSVRHLANLRIAAETAVAIEMEKDEMRARRRESAGHWRRELPGLAEGLLSA